MSMFSEDEEREIYILEKTRDALYKQLTTALDACEAAKRAMKAQATLSEKSYASKLVHAVLKAAGREVTP